MPNNKHQASLGLYTDYVDFGAKPCTRNKQLILIFHWWNLPMLHGIHLPLTLMLDLLIISRLLLLPKLGQTGCKTFDIKTLINNYFRGKLCNEWMFLYVALYLGPFQHCSVAELWQISQQISLTDLSTFSKNAELWWNIKHDKSSG